MFTEVSEVNSQSLYFLKPWPFNVKYLEKTFIVEIQLSLGCIFTKDFNSACKQGLWLLEPLQLLDAPADSLTTSEFFLECYGRCAAVPQPIQPCQVKQMTPLTDWSAARGTGKARPLLLGPRHIELSYSKKEPSLLDTPSTFQGRAVQFSNIYCVPASWKVTSHALVHLILAAQTY